MTRKSNRSKMDQLEKITGEPEYEIFSTGGQIYYDANEPTPYPPTKATRDGWTMTAEAGPMEIIVPADEELPDQDTPAFFRRLDTGKKQYLTPGSYVYLREERDEMKETHRYLNKRTDETFIGTIYEFLAAHPEYPQDPTNRDEYLYDSYTDPDSPDWYGHRSPYMAARHKRTTEVTSSDQDEPVVEAGRERQESTPPGEKLDPLFQEMMDAEQS